MSKSNPLIQTLNLGKAFSKMLSEKLEESVTEILSEWGKFEAEQKEKIRQFSEEISERVKQEANNSKNNINASSDNFNEIEDLQENLDQLRLEIARLRAELKNHRS